MATDASAVAGLSIRLMPDLRRTGAWNVVFRNDGPTIFDDLTFFVLQGGIPCLGDLGSTLIESRQLNCFNRFDELHIGSFYFTPGGDYLDLPLVASLCENGRELLRLSVTTSDFDRLEQLRGSAALPAHSIISWLLERQQPPAESK